MVSDTQGERAIQWLHDRGGKQVAASGVTRIRGIFSATQIGRQLSVAVQPFDVAATFADIARALAD